MKGALETCLAGSQRSEGRQRPAQDRTIIGGGCLCALLSGTERMVEVSERVPAAASEDPGRVCKHVRPWTAREAAVRRERSMAPTCARDLALRPRMASSSQVLSGLGAVAAFGGACLPGHRSSHAHPGLALCIPPPLALPFPPPHRNTSSRIATAHSTPAPITRRYCTLQRGC